MNRREYVQKIIEERLILSLKDTLTRKDKVRLKELATEIIQINVSPKTLFYKGFMVKVYRFPRGWIATKGDYKVVRGENLRELRNKV